jgi:hypothetical protein
MIEIQQKEENYKDNSILYLLVGITLGAVIVYIFVKDRQPIVQHSNDNISIIEQKLKSIEHQLNPPTNKLNIPADYFVPQNTEQNVVEPELVMMNDEDWTFNKSDNGKITGVSVKRKLYDTSKLIHK